MTMTITDIERAREMLGGHIVNTPLLAAAKLSEMTGAEIHIKLETLQATNSFKDRGSFVKLASLDDRSRRRGVIAMSAGNHAQAVAYHTRRMDIPATIVMPKTTPFNKVKRTRAHGANIILAGETLDDGRIVAEKMIAKRGLTLIHPYDDDRIIVGQGTIALEMLEQKPDLDMLIMPIGGGGLIGGNALAAKTLRPDMRIIGVEAELYPSMYCALRGETAQCGGATLAEGIAVKTVSERTVSLCRDYVDEVQLVGETAIEQAVMSLLCQEKIVVEGAGAVGLAAMLVNPERFRGRKVGLILCGGNIDPRLLASVIHRELKRARSIVSLRIEIEDRPGILGQISTLLGQAGANILEVWHRRMGLELSAKRANLDVMIETRGDNHMRDIIALIEAGGFVTRVIGAPDDEAVNGKANPVISRQPAGKPD
ncbi:MAG: threonine ammonia-lyase [Hyphomicrobiales bacterium]